MNPRTPIIVHTVQEPMISSRDQNMGQKKSRFGGRTLCIAISTLLFVVVGLILVFAFVRDPVSREAKETFQMLKECLNDTISTNMKELVIPDGECNDIDSTVFDLGAFRKLERLSVGSFSLGSILTVRIRNLKSLESIVFKEESFTRKNGELHIENCVALKTLSILDGSFHFFSALSLKSLPSLETLEIGADCFTEVEHFTLSSLPHLRSVSFGESSFIRKAGELRVENCQSLTELTVRDKAFGTSTSPGCPRCSD